MTKAAIGDGSGRRLRPLAACGVLVLATLFGLRAITWSHRAGALGVIQPPRQLLLGLGNDLFVALVAVLLLTLLAPRRPGHAGKGRAVAGFVPVAAAVLLCLSNTIHVVWMGANLSPHQFRYLLDLSVLLDSVLSDLVRVYATTATLAALGVAFWLIIAYRLIAGALTGGAGISNRLRLRTILALVLAAAALRSTLLSNRLILHEPLETNILTYLPWRLRLDREHQITAPRAGLAQLARLAADRPVAPTPVLAPGTNVLIILLESFSADLVASKPAIAPNLAALPGQPGWAALPRHFANTYRTVGAQFSAICSRFDPLSFYVIRDYPLSRVTCLPRLLKEGLGYRTVAIAGTRDGFDNVEEWYGGNAFDQVIAESGFAKDGLQRNTYGVHDEHLYPRILAELDAIKGPFFAYALTVSTHHPYSVPPGFLDSHPEAAGWPPLEQAYLYADFHLGEFLNRAADRAWFKNTLVVIAGDHPPWGYDPGTGGESFAHHVRRFMVTGLIRHPDLAGLKVNRMTSHLDLAPTILGLLGQPVPAAFQGASVFGPPAAPNLGSQDNQRDSYYQVFNDRSMIRIMSDGSACRAFDAAGPAARECSPEDLSTAREFRETFFDTVQWEITGDGRSQ